MAIAKLHAPNKVVKPATLSKHKIAIKIRKNPLPTKYFWKENKCNINPTPNSLRTIIAANKLYIILFYIIYLHKI